MRHTIVAVALAVFVVTVLAPLAWAAEAKPPEQPAAYTGLKKRVAVANIEMAPSLQINGTTVKESTDPGIGNVGSAMTEQLTTALINTGRFIVLERKNLSDVREEQALAKSGEVSAATAPAAGMLTGAEWIMRAAITEYTSKASRSVGGVKIGNVVLGGKRGSAKVVLDLRIIDATTGQVVDSVKAGADAKSSGALGGLAVKGVVLAAGKEDNTPIGQATREALAQAVDFICQRMDKLPWRGRVLDVDGADVIINAGSKANVRVGDQFDAYHLGKKLVDPDTGEVLQRQSKGGRLEVVEVQPGLAVCKVVAGEPPVANDIVRPLEPVQPPK